ncbi:hypothetical protein F9C07_7643 [Aspergillus flavus]|uniref:Uncharacterized protein n=1 Tax=Aspergillus flavus (strain ATCC 200026 / FGSC A1120 / IAM 13836 / NRRL 3357 / JCM 12722 / SRRC 167) TaxID=332952 RepID=A0A7U2MN91_ASPFN|nr:hypothetical protein F9C07_7643 [Aspergillus flavus]
MACLVTSSITLTQHHDLVNSFCILGQDYEYEHVKKGGENGLVNDAVGKKAIKRADWLNGDFAL